MVSPMYTYTSPFRHIDHDPSIDEDCDDFLCLAADDEDDPNEFAFLQWAKALEAMVEVDAGQPAFFALRHLAELALKLKAPTWNHREHDLAKLINVLPNGDPVKTPVTEEDLYLRDFLLDLNAHNENAVDGRYGYRNADARCLAERCHICKDEFLRHADLIVDYAGVLAPSV
jgi:hypothetical protein